jgi:TIR domain
MLEAEGWKVWWDTSLTIGDDFRNEIMTELGRARAVIVIWTDASVKSDWVRSEAGRAQADRKLIPVKLPHLLYKDLPPPFDVLHTENIGEDDKIRAAVVAQLAKPAVEPTAMALLTKGFKYEVLTWFGIVGGALTLFTNLGAVLKLADWARLLVQHWKEWTHGFWLWAFGWLGIHVPSEWPPVLSFLLFGSLLTIGQAFKLKPRITTEWFITRYQDRSFEPFEAQMTLAIVVMGPAIISLMVLAILSKTVSHVFLVILMIAVIVYPMLIIVPFANHRLHAAISVGLMLMFYIIIAIVPLGNLGGLGEHITPSDAGALGLVMILVAWISPLILLSAAPAKAVSRRLIFLALGLLLLIALNELSKLGLDVTAPKLQG